MWLSSLALVLLATFSLAMAALAAAMPVMKSEGPAWALPAGLSCRLRLEERRCGGRKEEGSRGGMGVAAARGLVGTRVW